MKEGIVVLPAVRDRMNPQFVDNNRNTRRRSIVRNMQHRKNYWQGEKGVSTLYDQKASSNSFASSHKETTTLNRIKQLPVMFLAILRSFSNDHSNLKGIQMASTHMTPLDLELFRFERCENPVEKTHSSVN
jgi:hypothetical protein